ncbi:MAG TPA: hypothetical protein VFV87_00260 [Pirellulaceae bacterium]|nr:hypothetical protein [Pirellulaceae bacterium]
MNDRDDQRTSHDSKRDSGAKPAPRYACPVCGGHLLEIRGKLQCERCHTIIETCCEGGPP